MIGSDTMLDLHSSRRHIVAAPRTARPDCTAFVAGLNLARRRSMGVIIISLIAILLL
jgi:hypothetical protein